MPNPWWDYQKINVAERIQIYPLIQEGRTGKLSFATENGRLFQQIKLIYSHSKHLPFILARGEVFWVSIIISWSKRELKREILYYQWGKQPWESSKYQDEACHSIY